LIHGEFTLSYSERGGTRIEWYVPIIIGGTKKVTSGDVPSAGNFGAQGRKLKKQG